MPDSPLTVLVTSIGSGGVGEQILKALQHVNAGRYRVIGADANPQASQCALVDERAVLPLANDPAYMDALLALIERYKVRALFCGSEPELLRLGKSRDLVEAKGVFLPINPTDVIELCMNKQRTNRKLDELGFESPRYMAASSKAELESIEWFPVVVKPSVGGGGSADVYIARNQKELIALAGYLGLEDGTTDFFIQEYVGRPEDEYTVGILHDMDGNYINSIALRRVLSGQLHVRVSVPNNTSREELGPQLVISSGVSHGFIGRFSEVTNQCKIIAAAIGARGPMNIQCRLVDGLVRVFEINPRFSGTTSLRAMVGYNEPDLLMQKHLFNKNVPVDFLYEEARIVRGITETKIAGAGA